MSLLRTVARASTTGRRAVAFGLVCIFAATIFATPVQAQESAADIEFAGMRQISVGDHWTFRSSGQDEGTIYNEVAEQETRNNWKDLGYESFRIHSSGELTSTQRTSTGLSAEVHVSFEVDKWVRTRDYATVHIEGETTIEERFQSTKRTDITESFSPPLVEILYPFAEGYHWKSQSEWYNKRGSEDAATSMLPYEVKVLGKERIRVPAGDFDAWKLSVDTARTSDSSSIQWYAPEVCDLVKEQRFDGEGKLINTMVLESFRCGGEERQHAPKYDPAYVRLISRGVAAGTDDPGPAFHIGIEQEDAPTVGYVAALAAVGVISLVAVGRRRWG